MSAHDPFDAEPAAPNPPAIATPQGASIPPAMAVHDDPSRPGAEEHGRTPEQIAAAVPGRTRVEWVHPSELPTAANHALGWGIGRGLDLQVAMARATARAPFHAPDTVRRTLAARKERRKLDTAPAPTTPPTQTTEGLTLS